LVENRCSDRYTKSTPDVSVADLIRWCGSNQKRLRQFALAIMMKARIYHGWSEITSIDFVINECSTVLWIQVALRNTLQEGDIQIPGFKLRLLISTCIYSKPRRLYGIEGSIVTCFKGPNRKSHSLIQKIARSRKYSLWKPNSDWANCRTGIHVPHWWKTHWADCDWG
jgi:hypothetical protein